jgi:glycosyltransferase involved in cell wall biosynthesis
VTTRVGVIGNMNNNGFALARYLRDAGLDAHVLLFDNELRHFHPSSDTFGDDYRLYVHQLAWGGPLRFPFVRPRAIRADLDDYDVLVGCGSAPAHCERAGRRLDVFVPFGGDLWTMLGKADGNPLRFAKYAPMRRAQARGIRSARVIHMAPTNDLYERQWQEYRGKSTRWYSGVPVVYAGEPDGPSEWEAAFRRVRDRADLMLFSSVRHHWRCPPDHPAAKGTDRLLRGIALLRRRRPSLRIALVTMEYGRHVRASRQLAHSLGIDDLVDWFPLLRRRDLMVGLRMADVACAEFENSWVASGVLYEAMVAARPILAHRDDALYGAEQRYPILNARDPQIIADRLEQTVDDPDAVRALGTAGHEWYREHVVDASVRRYVELVRSREAAG